MNINLGAPYELAIKRIIEKGYAGNQTEVIRQAVLDTIYILHCFEGHREYERWYKSYK